jgi:hypothetical protein
VRGASAVQSVLTFATVASAAAFPFVRDLARRFKDGHDADEDFDWRHNYAYETW